MHAIIDYFIGLRTLPQETYFSGYTRRGANLALQGGRKVLRSLGINLTNYKEGKDERMNLSRLLDSAENRFDTRF